MKTQQELLDYLAETDRERLALLAEVAALDTKRLRENPAPNLWSILEIIEHMVIAEKEVLVGLPDPERMNEQKRTAMTPLLFRVVLSILKYSVPVPVPSPTMLPQGNRSLESLKAEWERTRNWLQNYIELQSPQTLNRPVFLHPVTGGLSISEVMVMGQLHSRFHARQISKRLLTLTRSIG